MELLVLIICLGLIVGLVVRNKGDNTMDTLSKGCGCMTTFIILLILITLLAIWFTTNPESFNETFST